MSDAHNYRTVIDIAILRRRRKELYLRIAKEKDVANLRHRQVASLFLRILHQRGKLLAVIAPDR